MSTITLHVEGVGLWADGLPDWDAARAFVRDGALPATAPARPSPQLLAPNERRRAPDTVALALQVAQAACAMAGRDPAQLAAVFASTHGDLAITDYMCATLAGTPEAISPTRFHNSVHNAAAGYWSIGTGCMAPMTALSAHGCSFAQGLLEAALQVHAERQPVLLVAYDIHARGALAAVSCSHGLVGCALLLSPSAATAAAPTLRLRLQSGAAPAAGGVLHARYAGNAMAPALPLLEALARDTDARVLLASSPRQTLLVEIARGVPAETPA